MRITTKGQITIPQHIREKLGITPNTELDFLEKEGQVYLVKVDTNAKTSKFKRLRGIATIKMTTDKIMSLTRDS
jgi:AbrB family looped-hinge helix DNA binding protein